MILHIALFRWKETTTPADITAIEAGLRELPAAIPELLTYTFGPNVGTTEGNFDFAVLATFERIEDYPKYVEHPAHQEVVVNLVRPHLAERSSLQFEG